MKKPMILAVLLTVFSTASFASSGATALSSTSKFQVVENTNSRYDLYYVSENFGDVTIQITNQNGTVINSDKVSSVKAFKRTYNLKALPAGNYNVEVKNEEGKASQLIYHNPAIVSSLHAIVGQLPEVNKFKVFVGPSHVNSKVLVKIYNDKEELLLTETIKSVEGGFIKVYNLTKLDTEFVRFKIDNGTDSNSFTRILKQ